MKRTLLTFAVTFALGCASHAGIYKSNKADVLGAFVLHPTEGQEISFPVGVAFEYRVYDVNDPKGEKAYMAQDSSL
jgi:hypothetical protein